MRRPTAPGGRSCRACAAKRASSVPARARTGQRSVERRSHNGTWVPAPHNRKLEASPGALLRRRSARSAASEDNRPNRGPRSQPTRKRSTSPALSSSSAVASSAAAPTCTRLCVLYASGPADEDRMVQGKIRTGDDVKGHPGPQGIAEQAARLIADNRPHRLGHHRGGRRQIGPHGVGAAVTGKVHRRRVCALRPDPLRSDPRADRSV